MSIQNAKYKSNAIQNGVLLALVLKDIVFYYSRGEGLK